MSNAKIVETDETTFKPVTIQLNLDTPRKLKYFLDICSYNETIPHTLGESSDLHNSIMLSEVDRMKLRAYLKKFL